MSINVNRTKVFNCRNATTSLHRNCFSLLPLSRMNKFEFKVTINIYFCGIKQKVKSAYLRESYMTNRVQYNRQLSC